ncbi:MAG: amidohydrolase [Acidaminococcaceae bacterium]|nr:amidohydrolase [Acidaminococcaceae bacterium]
MKKYEKIMQEVSSKIWDCAELKFAEYDSSSALCSVLRAEGFLVKEGLADMPTAFTATFGSGHPIIGILGEFDALSGLSQQADVVEISPIKGKTCGHGCGHHLLGTAALGAVLAVRDYLHESGKSGTVIMFGCPGEEGGSGKAYMARAGVFDKLDVALTWHPASGNAVMTGSMQANCQAYFRFKGVSAHAASAPHLGRSALDAVELMNVGVNYLREHMETTDRIHYAVLDTGGTSPNVVQGHAESIYLVRSTDAEKVKKLYERVCNVARGAAMMTGTKLEIVFDKACSNVLSNSVLEELLHKSMLAVPLPTYTLAEVEYAQKFKKTINSQDIGSDLSLIALDSTAKKLVQARYAQLPVADFVLEYEHKDIFIAGSSDVGDTSHVVPTAQFTAACFVPGTPAHSWQMVAQGKSSIALKGMFYAADVLASATKKIIDDSSFVTAAQAEFKIVTEGQSYVCPIPAEVKPNV